MTWTLADARATVLNRDGGACVICGHRAEECHHRFRRGMGGSKDPDIHSPANLLSLCGFHHRMAESLRTELSAPNGWCVIDLPAAFLSPVLTRMGWLLPMDGGTWIGVGPASSFKHTDEARSRAHLLGLLPA